MEYGDKYPTKSLGFSWQSTINICFWVKLNKFLIDNGVSNAEFYPVPLHLQKALLYLGYKEGDFPVAEKVCTETICLPVFPDLNQEQLDYIALKVKEFYEKKGN